MSQNNDLQALVTRTEQLISALTNAFVATAEVAAERIELAAQVARVQQRMGRSPPCWNRSARKRRC